MNHAIEASGLTKVYRGGVRALDGLSFAVEEGTVFGLLGPNGAGKSTAVRILTTLAKHDGGSARVAGFDVAREPENVRRAIGCVAQKSGLDVDATGRENLTLQGRLCGMAGSDIERRAGELLGRFGLAGAGDRAVRGYSGGMQRRLDVAMGLMHRPRVLFLDEPTTGLDPEARATMWQELSTLVRDERLTVLLTTHYLEEADRLAGRLAIVDRGRVVVQGSPDELKANLRGDSIQVELGAPETDPFFLEVLAEVAGVRDVSIDGSRLFARLDGGSTAIPAVLAVIESMGAAIASVRVASPSLDDVYLRHAGRAYHGDWV
ncbi:MAG TPA: ATP-binding cassette domain-containing protein [Polyangiaceae bacterium]|nr:ATP-binding cassette domain-containing protein [Polyangiaceae bacterium]